MKEKFLALVEEVKVTGIVAALSGASNPEELEAVWNEFEEKNSDLFEKANAWGNEFLEADITELFESEESFENPVEIAVTIVMVGNEISDSDIFQDYEELMIALNSVGSNFAYAIAEFIDTNHIYNITSSDFFQENEGTYEDEENGGTRKEAEPGDDGYDSVAPCLGDYFDDDFDLIPGRE